MGPGRAAHNGACDAAAAWGQPDNGGREIMADAPQNLHQALPGLRRIVQRFWPYIRQERRLIVSSLIALLSSVILRLAEPWPLKYIFDRVIRLSTSRKPRTSGFAWLDTLQ